MQLAQVDIYTHYFKLSMVHPWLIPPIKQAIGELTQIQIFKQYGKIQQKASRVYATLTKDYKEFRFHRNYYQRFVDILKNYRMDINDTSVFTVIEHEVYTPKEASVRMPDSVVMRDYQEVVIDYCLDDGTSKLISLYTGGGKAGPVNSLVKIPNGWKRLGDLVQGDIISSPSGSSTEVTGVYDQGMKECIKFTFVDGREAIASLEHNWDVWVVSDRTWRVLTTDEIYRRFQYMRSKPTGICGHDSTKEVNVRLAIPLVNPIMSPDKELFLPLDPYLLGVILGDGSITITGAVGISKPDLDLFTECERILKDYNCATERVYMDSKCPLLRIKRTDEKINEVADILVRIGLNGTRAWDKFIPDIYLNASFNQRLRLIQGLMDTDGSVCNDGSSLEFTTTSETMAYQIVYLLRSLGCIAAVNDRVTQYTHNGEIKDGRVSYRIRIKAQIPSMLFFTPIKKSKCQDVTQYNRKGLKLRITNMEPVGKLETRCIRVADKESLYITNDFVVTHNTFTALKIAELMRSKVLIVILGRYMEKWIEDVIGAFGKDCDYVVVKGSNDLNRLLHNAQATGSSPDVTLITTTTLQNYIKSWEQGNEFERDAMVNPSDICETLGIGLRILDEAHQHFHANFKMDLYLHCPKALYLTATLESSDRFMLRMYELMWPSSQRAERVKPPAYDYTYALHYMHTRPEKIRCTSNQGYSHVMYEQSIWRYIPSRVAYLEMIGSVVEKGFLPYYKPGRKMLIFCSLIETCQYVSEYLQKRFKDQQWQISKFTAGDPKELIDTNDITVSTLGKAGTALDVYGLITCLMTVALSEPKANIQAKGRLRNIQVKEEFKDIVPRFYYFVADDLERPREYGIAKERLFADRTLRLTNEYFGFKVGAPIKELYPYGIPDYTKGM